MNKFIATLVVSLFTSVANGIEYQCSQHQNVLEITRHGTEHINHSITLNGKTPIKELETEMWFVESVTCTNQGFQILASHAQYNDPTKKSFSITISESGVYEVD